MTASPVISASEDIEARVGAVDWERAHAELDQAGNAILPGLLSPGECDALAGLYPAEEPFRGRIVMVERIVNEPDRGSRSDRGGDRPDELDHKVTLLRRDQLEVVRLSKVHGVTLQDGDLAMQLHRRLDASAGEGMFQQVEVEIRLNDKRKHDLVVSYVVAAPMWKPKIRHISSGNRISSPVAFDQVQCVLIVLPAGRMKGASTVARSKLGFAAHSYDHAASSLMTATSPSMVSVVTAAWPYSCMWLAHMSSWTSSPITHVLSNSVAPGITRTLVSAVEKRPATVRSGDGSANATSR